MTELNDIMSFDHVIEVQSDGGIVARPDIFAPELIDGEVQSKDWELLNGYSGQDRYSGPIMHNSEFISGGLETDIRENPGVYVALICTWLNDEDDDEDDAPYTVEGWAVARLRDPNE